jgi:DNA-binding GntR family transcriptional regulator
VSIAAEENNSSAVRIPRPARGPRTTTSREVIDYIRAQIFTGQLAAGARINQDKLAEDFGVSRLPVREALITLESEGLVRSELHRGVYIIPITRADIEDHYTVYGYIQGLAARRATPLLTEENLARLEAVNEELSSAKDPEVLRDLDWQFHSIINRAGGSNRLLRILRQLGRALPQSLYAVPPAASERAIVEHRAIISALREKDAKSAADQVVAHTNREGVFLAKLLEDEGVLTAENVAG